MERGENMKKITLFGATGRVGKEILNFLLSDGYSVTALVRSPEKIITSPNLRIIKGDATTFKDVELAISDSDAVVSALNTDGQQTLSLATPNMIEAMVANNITRIITIGTAGILQSRLQPELFRFQSTESRRRTTRAAEEHLAAFNMLKSSPLKWTIICPTYLPDGELTKQYRYSADFLPLDGKEISVEDTAHFAYDQLFKEEFVYKRVGICY